VADDHWGEVAAAAVRLNVGMAVRTEDLKAHCRELLAPHKTPTEWFVVERFPLTASGKIQKFALRVAAVSGALNKLSSRP
jgi:acyl-coenzyme A synthetase/AMP-(fatty) acid ligase